MPLTQYTPEFPYKQNQIILTSDRVVLHSKSDSIFLFGKQAVGVSTNGTFNVDARVGMTVATPIIELGADAKLIGHPVLKSKAFVRQLDRLLTQIESFAEAMTQLKSDSIGLAESIPVIVSQAEVLKKTTADVKVKIPSTYSQTTYTT